MLYIRVEGEQFKDFGTSDERRGERERKMTDEKIIELYFSRSEDAITETDKKYGAYCRTMSHNITGSREDSEECVNDTYLKVWNVIPPQRPPRFGAFVVRICRNIALNMRRAKGMLKRSEEYEAIRFEEVSECLPSKENVEKTFDEKAAIKALEKFLSGLSPEKRSMFVRRYFYFSSYAQIAADLGVSEGKVKMTVSRTREKLREYLEKEGIDL